MTKVTLGAAAVLVGAIGLSGCGDDETIPLFPGTGGAPTTSSSDSTSTTTTTTTTSGGGEGGNGGSQGGAGPGGGGPGGGGPGGGGPGGGGPGGGGPGGGGPGGGGPGGGGPGGGGPGGGGPGGGGPGGGGPGGGGPGGGGPGGGGPVGDGTCGDPFIAADPSSQSDTTVGAPNNSSGIDCGGFNTGLGPELIYQVTPAFTGTLDLTLTINDVTADLGVYVETVCGDATTVIGCADTGGAGTTETLSVAVAAGVPVFVYVDGYTALDAGAFTIDVQTTPDPEELLCANLIDDDGDGLFDCEDPTTCQGTPACTPGAALTGAACTAPTDCAATGGDPLCLLPSVGFFGGYCSEFCNLIADDCAGDAVCVDVFQLPSGNGTCFDGCVNNANCRTPQYSCQNVGLPTKLCLPSSCGVATPGVLGDNVGDTTNGIDSLDGSCQIGGGFEQVFTFTPAMNGTVTLTVTTPASDADLGVYVRTSCNGPPSEIGCSDAFGGGMGVVESLTVVATAGVPLSIIVDGYSDGVGGPFILNIAQP